MWRKRKKSFATQHQTFKWKRRRNRYFGAAYRDKNKKIEKKKKKKIKITQNDLGFPLSPFGEIKTAAAATTTTSATTTTARWCFQINFLCHRLCAIIISPNKQRNEKNKITKTKTDRVVHDRWLCVICATDKGTHTSHTNRNAQRGSKQTIAPATQQENSAQNYQSTACRRKSEEKNSSNWDITRRTNDRRRLTFYDWTKDDDKWQRMWMSNFLNWWTSDGVCAVRICVCSKSNFQFFVFKFLIYICVQQTITKRYYVSYQHHSPDWLTLKV